MSEPSHDPPVYLLWDQVTFDSAPWDPNRKMEFFVDPPSSSPNRVTSLDEKALVRWLMGCKPAKALIFQKLGRESSAFDAAELVEPFYDHGEGEIDLLLCDRLDPGAAVALECKRIKVEGVDAKNDHMNKLPDTVLAVQQANKLYEKCGFRETYLALLVAIDSYKQLDSNIPCRGLRPNSTHDFGETKTQRAILNFPGREDLNTKIGIIFIEVVQPSGKPLDEMATVRVLIFHPATPRFQRARATSQMTSLIEKVSSSPASESDSAGWVAASLGTVEFRIGNGADAPGDGMSANGPGAIPGSPASVFTLRNWKTVIRRNPR